VREDPQRNATVQVAGTAVARLSLLVISESVCITRPLPDEGDVVIGRDVNTDVSISDGSISRRHLRLRIGPTITAEDLGSANGSRVRDTWLAPGSPVPVSCGEVIEVGNAMLILQELSAPVRRRRIWEHVDFEARLDEECVRADRLAGSFAVAHVCGEERGGDALRAALETSVRAADVVGRFTDDEYEVILLDTTEAGVAAAEERIRRALEAAGTSGGLGIALYPRDGRGADALLAVARAAARGGQPDSGRPAVVAARTDGLDRLVSRIAAGTISVLVLGETGVGKEVMASRIHQLSPRAKKPFLGLNCAALSESLLESELFGHERGAFTGAVQAKPGLLETADGGTVFLDEVGELPPSIQVKLLRVLEVREVLRVGGLKARTIDVRFVAATNRDLETEVAAGRFRDDLYFRLNGVTLVIPPLRQRVAEIMPLAAGFVEQFCREAGHPAVAITSEARSYFERYSWPGNIRELRNVVERAVLLSGGEPIAPEHLPVEKMRALDRPTPPLRRAGSSSRLSAPAQPRPTPTPRPTPSGGRRRRQQRESGIRGELRDLERERILEALEECAGNQSRAAELLGMSRRTLVNRLTAYGVPRPRARRKRKP